MTFVNRLPDIVPGHGAPAQNDSLFLKETFVLSGTNPELNYLTGGLATGKFVPTIGKGKIRAKFAAPSTSGATPALSKIVFVLDDGTTYVEVKEIESLTLAVQPAAGSMVTPNFADFTFEFEVDIAATRLGIYSTLSGTNPIVLMDVELSGTTGRVA